MNYTKLSSTTAGTVRKRHTGARNCKLRGNIAGSTAIVGGMKMAIAGARSTTGMTTITTTIITTS